MPPNWSLHLWGKHLAVWSISPATKTMFDGAVSVSSSGSFNSSTVLTPSHIILIIVLERGVINSRPHCTCNLLCPNEKEMIALISLLLQRQRPQFLCHHSLLLDMTSFHISLMALRAYSNPKGRSQRTKLFITNLHFQDK